MIVRDNNKLLSSHNNLSPYVQSVGPVSCVGSRPPIGGTQAVAHDLRPFSAQCYPMLHHLSGILRPPWSMAYSHHGHRPVVSISPPPSKPGH